ncbi:MAG: hypothetical protein M3365_03230 [Gemmatimonadota bacterium]|nr:hypothetical protein [Gemmatimonadota bacterium]
MTAARIFEVRPTISFHLQATASASGRCVNGGELAVAAQVEWQRLAMSALRW